MSSAGYWVGGQGWHPPDGSCRLRRLPCHNIRRPVSHCCPESGVRAELFLADLMLPDGVAASLSCRRCSQPGPRGGALCSGRPRLCRAHYPRLGPRSPGASCGWRSLVVWGWAPCGSPCTWRTDGGKEDLPAQQRTRQTPDVAHAHESLQAEMAARQRAEASLQQQRDWLDVALASLGEAVITTDIRLTVTFCNQAAENLTGWRGLWTHTHLLPILHLLAAHTAAYDHRPGGAAGHRHGARRADTAIDA